eukprot:TRINITY_DN78582_c0_g1_i1.p1 TRINITY_DN78582_c0_g1~~TRINITY_DN78582_c0_g1_i1.p1  ORF type:complete len:364 (+),score=41.10 TRINITY_DN78582_c0_g1_i1:82-1173(+)
MATAMAVTPPENPIMDKDMDSTGDLKKKKRVPQINIDASFKSAPGDDWAEWLREDSSRSTSSTTATGTACTTACVSRTSTRIVSRSSTIESNSGENWFEPADPSSRAGSRTLSRSSNSRHSRSSSRSSIPGTERLPDVSTPPSSSPPPRSQKQASLKLKKPVSITSICRGPAPKIPAAALRQDQATEGCRIPPPPPQRLPMVKRGPPPRMPPQMEGATLLSDSKSDAFWSFARNIEIPRAQPAVNGMQVRSASTPQLARPQAPSGDAKRERVREVSRSTRKRQEATSTRPPSMADAKPATKHSLKREELWELASKLQLVIGANDPAPLPPIRSSYGGDVRPSSPGVESHLSHSRSAAVCVMSS